MGPSPAVVGHGPRVFVMIAVVALHGFITCSGMGHVPIALGGNHRGWQKSKLQKKEEEDAETQYIWKRNHNHYDPERGKLI